MSELPSLAENHYRVWLRIITEFGWESLPSLAGNHYRVWLRIITEFGWESLPNLIES